MQVVLPSDPFQSVSEIQAFRERTGQELADWRKTFAAMAHGCAPKPKGASAIYTPKSTITPEMAADRPDLEPLVGQSLTVIAWLWARTVKSPNPAYSHVDVPLVSTFVLSSKEGKRLTSNQ